MSVVVELIHMVFTTEGFFEEGIESSLVWYLNPRPLNSAEMLPPTEQSDNEFNSHWVQNLYSHHNLTVFHCEISFQLLYLLVATYILI